MNIFPLKKISSFILIIFNIVAACLYLDHSSLRNFCNMMPRHEPVIVIYQLYSSGSRVEGGVEFICCVHGQEPQIHKLWSFAKDRITREVHAHAIARRVCDACLWENFLARAQNVLYAHHIGGDELINWFNDNWDDL